MVKRMERKPSVFSFRSAFFIITPILLCLSFISEGVDMFGWFKKKQAYLSPIVQGVVKENGKPVANIQVSRQLIYMDDIERDDYAETDEKGQFYFPEKTIMSRLASNPLSEQRSSQYIYIKRGDKEYQLWGTVQTAFKEVPEYSKKLASLHCDLNDKLVSFAFKKNNHTREYMATSICRWQEDYIPYYIYDGEKKFRIHKGDFSNLTELK